MKKMVTLLAVMLMAGFTYSATLIWGSFDASNMYAAQNQSGSTLTSGSVFLYLLTSSTDVPSYSSGWNLNGATLVATGVIDGDGTTIGMQGLWGGAESTASTVADSYFNSTAYYVAVLATQTSASSVGDVNSGYYYVSDVTQFDAGTLDIANKMGTLYFDDNITSASWSAVPEPTSMALVVLGAVAIGLRRKFRK